MNQNEVELGQPQAPKLRRVTDLLPYANNSRTHSDEQVAELASSIDEFGMVGAIVVREGTIAKGHGTLMAVRKLYEAGKRVYPAPGKKGGAKPYPEGTIPALDVSGWSEVQFKAYVIADNKLALNAGWDMELLKLELADLQMSEFDLSITGFSQDELDELFKLPIDPPEADPDKVPDPPEIPISVPGDVWVLGPHKVMCGNSLQIDDWQKLLGKERADICWTDPPYNVAYEGKTAAAMKIKSDDMEDEEFKQFLVDAFLTLFIVMKPGAAIYVAHPDREAHQFHYAFRKAGFKFSSMVVWKKNSIVLSRTDYQSMHEPILYGWKPGGKHRWYGGRKLTSVHDAGPESPFTKQEDGSYAFQLGDEVLIVRGDAQIERTGSSVIYADKPARNEKHPTMKPVDLVLKMLVNNARRGDIVVDPFSGSGSTMIAAEQASMCARNMELDPRFVDVQCQRYYEFTGRVPVHAESGLPFPVKDEDETAG